MNSLDKRGGSGGTEHQRKSPHTADLVRLLDGSGPKLTSDPTNQVEVKALRNGVVNLHNDLKSSLNLLLEADTSRGQIARLLQTVGATPRSLDLVEAQANYDSFIADVNDTVTNGVHSLGAQKLRAALANNIIGQMLNANKKLGPTESSPESTVIDQLLLAQERGETDSFKVAHGIDYKSTSTIYEHLANLDSANLWQAIAQEGWSRKYPATKLKQLFEYLKAGKEFIAIPEMDPMIMR